MLQTIAEDVMKENSNIRQREMKKRSKVVSIYYLISNELAAISHKKVGGHRVI